jgi:hypothetical protein
MSTMYPGGPNTYSTEYPIYYDTFPQFMRDCVDPTTPPPSPLAMSLTCAALMAVPVIGYNAAYSLGQYQQYYATGYNASPPGSHTDTPIEPTAPTNWVPVVQATVDIAKTIGAIALDVIGAGDEAVAIKAVVDLILDRLPGTIAASPTDVTDGTSAIESALDAAVSALQGSNSDQTDAIDALISGAKDALDTLIDGAENNIRNGETGSITSVLNDLVAFKDSVQQFVLDETETLQGDTAQILALLHKILGYPGPGSVSFGEPVILDGSGSADGPMDGCVFEVTSVAPGTGQQVVDEKVNYLHLGWLCFYADDDSMDEVQWLGQAKAVYVPRRLAHPAGVVVYAPRLLSGTVTPWTIATE